MTTIFSRPLRIGMVGGGRGAFIGAVHKIACELDGKAQLVAGALSSDPTVATESAANWFLPRSYHCYQEMALAEAAHPEGIDAVIITTPNHLHASVASAFIKAGIHVMCEKPLAFNLTEALELEKLVTSTAVVMALAHSYTGYPAVEEAKAKIANGDLGVIRKVLVEYHQDWLMQPLEQQSDNKQAGWRTDPNKAGISCCVGDIGTHAANLVEYITGDIISEVCADLSSFVDGRTLDDDANMLLRLRSGAKGTLTCSQIACGEENNLRIRIYGSKGAMEWQQQEPNSLRYCPAGQPWQLLRTGVNLTAPLALAGTRLPGGHPEGYFESLANIYRRFFQDIQLIKAGKPALGGYPGITDGVRGMAFIEKAVQSAQSNSKWLSLT